MVCPSVCSLTLDVAITVQLYIMYSHHIRCAHQCAPLPQLSASECPFTSGIPITVPPYIRYSPQSALLHHIPHQSAPFYHMRKSDCPFPSHVPIRVPFPQYVPISALLT
ncbi:unnamed protein product [Staurois parvus]|uniref:Uncharacterized protein n=1 Tax=Staurois parvus TaxID=386267 RepID=A0ABN9EYH0_9NEOB|nr:unnamed protein product [Staurois parvus]